MRVWFLFWGFTLALTVASLLPGTDLPAITYNDKVAHFAAYFLYAVIANALPLGRKRLYALMVGIAAYGLLLEGAQGLLITGRHASLLDALANALGVLAAALILSRYWQARRQP